MMDAEDFDVWFEIFKAAISGGSPPAIDLALHAGEVADAGLLEVRKRLPHS